MFLADLRGFFRGFALKNNKKSAEICVLNLRRSARNICEKYLREISARNICEKYLREIVPEVTTIGKKSQLLKTSNYT
jgi:hypothetical protein